MKTKLMIGIAGAALLAAGTPSAASAATTITGAVSGINLRGTDPGLVLWANALAFPSFTLNSIGDYRDFDVLRIGTTEGGVRLFEDTAVFPISASFTFDGATGPSVGGSTFGFMLPLTSCGIMAGGCGRVDWSGPSTFSFGNGGQFSVELSDVTFGTPGSANVRGRFTLLADSVPAVPEPATWTLMLLGFGTIGGAMRYRRKSPLVRSFA